MTTAPGARKWRHVTYNLWIFQLWNLIISPYYLEEKLDIYKRTTILLIFFSYFVLSYLNVLLFCTFHFIFDKFYWKYILIYGKNNRDTHCVTHSYRKIHIYIFGLVASFHLLKSVLRHTILLKYIYAHVLNINQSIHHIYSN